MLSACQRSSDCKTTNPLTAHRRVVTPYLSALRDLAVPSVSSDRGTAYSSIGELRTRQLSRASERMSEKKPLSLLTTRPGPGNSFSSNIQLSHASPEIVPHLRSSFCGMRACGWHARRGNERSSGRDSGWRLFRNTCADADLASRRSPDRPLTGQCSLLLLTREPMLPGQQLPIALQQYQ